METLAWEKFLIGTPGIQENKQKRSSVNVVVIFWTKIFIYVKITELFTV
jgi:hypothetical protein